MSGNRFGFLTSREVCERAQISRSTLDKIMREDPSFPEPFRPSPNTTLHREGAIDDWVAGYRKGQHRSKRLLLSAGQC
jgi:predicted DNA-binding transcriptional regulator AlpA